MLFISFYKQKGGMLTENDILQRLYSDYYGPALLYTLSLCGQQELAEDIVTDAFVKAWLTLPQEIPSFRYWLLRVCKNLWIDYLRRHKYCTSVEEFLQSKTDPDTPESIYLSEERMRCLWKAIGTLSAVDREIMILHCFAGLPLREVARLSGKSYSDVRQRLCRLRRALKGKMKEDGYDL